VGRGKCNLPWSRIKIKETSVEAFLKGDEKNPKKKRKRRGMGDGGKYRVICRE